MKKIIYKRAPEKNIADDGVRIEISYDLPTATAKALAEKLGAEFVSGSVAFGGLRHAVVAFNGVRQTWLGRVFF